MQTPVADYVQGHLPKVLIMAVAFAKASPRPPGGPIHMAVLALLLASAAALEKPRVVQQEGEDLDGTCAYVPTSIPWIPSWLHVRSRLSAALWGEEPLRAAEASALAALAAPPEAARCPLGAVSVRLALAEAHLRILGPPLPDALNFTRLSAEWLRLRRVSFIGVVRSGWPAFELLWRIQEHLTDLEPSPVQAALGARERCDLHNSAEDTAWLEHIWPQLDARKLKYVEHLIAHATPYDMVQRVQKEQPVCHLAIATYYLMDALVMFNKPRSARPYWNDNMPNLIPPAQYIELVLDEASYFFLLKAQAYGRTLLDLLASRWPVLRLLGTISSQVFISEHSRAYLAPFVRNIGRQAGEKVAMIECGAHDGHNTVNFAKLLPDVRIWAFEANPILFRQLEERVRKCGEACALVRPVELALGSEDRGSVEFFVNVEIGSDEAWGSDSTSSLYPPHNASHNRSKYFRFQEKPLSIKLRRLQSFAEEVEFGTLRFMELDAQGGDLDIVRGAGTLLQQVNLVQMEVLDPACDRGAEAVYRGAPLWPTVKAALEELGFVVLFRTCVDVLFLRRHLALL